ncbi:MAG: hypothetical protein P8J59_10785 [Phycisphaerales bacterium]|nr:hypothetical protein [Phycisphaerales bacterium]
MPIRPTGVPMLQEADSRYACGIEPARPQADVGRAKVEVFAASSKPKGH